MKAMLCSLVMGATICTAGAETTKREAFEACLGAGIDRFKGLCEPADLLARAILFECNPQLTDLLISMPLGPSNDRVALAEKHRRDKTEEVLTLLLEHRLQHPCR
ncbi:MULTISPECIES: hypothetical protein [unclassified Mesorhizobium]|uniref:hypothetical protein n=1 Tax=unclassified Mesorhizobium TaxID=325217 RepID=UPI0003CE005C|nr:MULTISPECIES: hypothetical protein [unclassified Mesorhizobium]ESY10573.1 hypothetical protein X752_17215 [Mesorhizobium sp. LNJC398B00]ESY32749.1 hypothetical protein X749_03630 [Mesorhizobium sp. LNJC391B00]ESY41982.1 hypothetical protein X747_14130 [Mesorhizobium sp. LNJC384A00]ESZ43044.1 hypothetical protein X732_08095 [Mesorhizobium sp. L2C066B000]